MNSRLTFRIAARTLAAILFTGCTCSSPVDWYDTGRPVKSDCVDVFYLPSTAVLHSPKGYLAEMNGDDKAALAHEVGYVQKNIYGHFFNVFSPYYHQLTMDAYRLEPGQRTELERKVSREVCRAFDHYMRHLNGGRRFILAGYSQGGMLVKEILKHMTDEQYSRLVAAYVIGWEVTEEDLKCPHIVPATGATDLGVTVSFNSVENPEARWTMCCDNPAICINPLNWHTDAAVSKLYYGFERLDVSVDTLTRQVVVSGWKDGLPEDFYKDLWPEGCLHGQELRLWAKNLQDNAWSRSYTDYSMVDELIVGLRALQISAMQRIHDELEPRLPEGWTVTPVVKGLDLDALGVPTRHDFRPLVWLIVHNPGGEEFWIMTYFEDQDFETGNTHIQFGRIQFWKNIRAYSKEWCRTANTPVGDGLHWIFNHENSGDPKIKLYDPDYSPVRVVDAFLEFVEE